MFATRPAHASDVQTVTDSAPFFAVVVTGDRPGVLRALTSQAVEHFHHDRLFIRDVQVVPSSAGKAFLATAIFSTLAPEA